MKKTCKSKKFLAVASLGICIIISLISTLFFQVRKVKSIKDSLYQIHAVELAADMEKLLANIRDNDVIRSYHYAMSAADNASKSGERNMATQMKKIAEQIIENGITEEIFDIAVNISSDKNHTATSNNANKSVEKSTVHSLPSFVASQRYDSAKENANYIFGGEDVVNNGVPNGAGKIIFTCANAYALIDEKTSLPLEASLSYSKIDDSKLPLESEKVAEDFLIRFFSRNLAEHAVLEEKSIDEESGLADLKYSLGKRKIYLAVEEDSGRIVRYFIEEA